MDADGGTKVAQPSKRAAILNAGRAEFHERGYNATGIAGITTRADGAHKGSFYNHFPSKEDLAIEVITDYGKSQRMEMLHDVSVEPLARIQAHFEFMAEELRKEGLHLGCLLGNFAAEMSSETPRMRATVIGKLTAWSSLLAAALDEAANIHSAEGHDSETTAWLMIDAYEGAALRGRATDSPAPMNSFLTVGLPQMLRAFAEHYTS
ncbi:TetR family transcriptional regulator C-terminal domain-containing protein [Nocardia sp. NPDC049190]|uniref:TetR/AcrR family transcriptional regulator n=1 Tax=Nocardia sp. NPDC049190 TaxID=3155650 RepID=UPI0033EC9419